MASLEVKGHTIEDGKLKMNIVFRSPGFSRLRSKIDYTIFITVRSNATTGGIRGSVSGSYEQADVFERTLSVDISEILNTRATFIQVSANINATGEAGFGVDAKKSARTSFGKAIGRSGGGGSEGPSNGGSGGGGDGVEMPFGLSNKQVIIGASALAAAASVIGGN